MSLSVPANKSFYFLLLDPRLLPAAQPKSATLQQFVNAIFFVGTRDDNTDSIQRVRDIYQAGHTGVIVVSSKSAHADFVAAMHHAIVIALGTASLVPEQRTGNAAAAALSIPELSSQTALEEMGAASVVKLYNVFTSQVITFFLTHLFP